MKVNANQRLFSTRDTSKNRRWILNIAFCLINLRSKCPLTLNKLIIIPYSTYANFVLFLSRRNNFKRTQPTRYHQLTTPQVKNRQFDWYHQLNCQVFCIAEKNIEIYFPKNFLEIYFQLKLPYSFSLLPCCLSIFVPNTRILSRKWL